VGYRNFDVLKKHSTASDYENAASLAPVNAQFEIIEK
jgi:hypothetical protein